MPPKRDIRDFFKPASQPSRPPYPPTSPPQTDGNAPRVWPSARSTFRHGNVSARSSPTSPTSTHIGTKQSWIITDTTPRATMTTCPPSTSQSSTNSSGSKRIVLNGEQMVQNSDSDTDSDSLEEIDFGLKKKSPPRKIILDDFKANGKTRGGPTLRSGPFSRTQKNALRRPSDRPAKFSKSSLNHLAAKAQQFSEIERDIAENKADMEKPVEQDPTLDLVISEEVLAGVVTDQEGGDKAKRLYLAMQRTNALDHNHVFHFFSDKFDPSSVKPSDFPSECLPNQHWATNFEGSGICPRMFQHPLNFLDAASDQAFLSGYAQQIFQFQELPEELASWMIEQICLGRSDMLSNRYIQLLEADSRHLQAIFTRDGLDFIFNCLGADTQCLNSLQGIVPSREPPDAAKRPLPPALKWVIHLLERAAKSVPPTSRSDVLYLLFHVCFDDSVMSNAEVLHSVQSTIEKIICVIPPDELTPVLNDFLPSLLPRITHPILQNNLVQSLPANTPLTAHLQRHLALAFFIQPKQLNVPLSDPSVPFLIRSHIQNSPDYVFTKKTDYKTLAARLSLLDVAIGPGPMTVPYVPIINPTPPPGPSTTASTSASTPIYLSPEEIAFNKQVDRLAQQVKLLSNNIVETGALSDMARLDAKDASERLYHRLDHAVRTRGRNGGNPFEDEGKVKFQTPMNKWFVKTAASRAASVSGEANSVKSEAVSVSGEDCGIKSEMTSVNGPEGI
ncbi:uncharacterized protein BDR25DRAFT_81533 [Lindgomyces ingoldianus]|uniref:Uncharacterized protein n=1 Tax=Lindgomyces ingoldianus TaxID=673940 RepID=A0ACB6QGD8_9PLEO|nr:uncharacterized protein BDR25DRAFT_81533 [Lindgomyces ingoldianus]KAF2465956.1 hypothetical protein BDR25DRAFT_81533 [Lindgomyces ingoldianus]